MIPQKRWNLNLHKEEVLCHLAEEAQVQEVHEAEAAHVVVVHVAGAAVHQEDGAVHHIAAPTVVLIEAVVEVCQHILRQEYGETSPPVCRRTLKQSQLF